MQQSGGHYSFDDYIIIVVIIVDYLVHDYGSFPVSDCCVFYTQSSWLSHPREHVLLLIVAFPLGLLLLLDTNIRSRKGCMIWFNKDRRIFKGITILIVILTTIYTGSLWIIHCIWLSRHSIFIYLISHPNYLLTHTHTRTCTHTLSLLTTSYSFVALLWRAGRVLYEGLTRWLRYCLDREIDQ